MRHSFPKGQPRAKGAGRKKGTPNKASVEIKDFARSILEDPDYKARLKVRILSGKAPHIEQLLYFYGYGKPAETMKVEPGEGCTFTLKIDGNGGNGHGLHGAA